jgi:hypothetical protein
MTRKEIISEVSKHFYITELVCDHTWNKFAGLSWQFLDTELLETLLVLRTRIFKVQMNINFDQFHQRGLRCNICQLVKDKTNNNQIYLSAHCNGAAFDADVLGLTAEQARQKIRDNASLLPHPIRMEKDVNWLHVDIYDSLNGQKITEFNG